MTVVETRLALWRNGYAPIPVNGKKPAFEKRQTKDKTNADEIALHVRMFPAASNTGTLTQRAPAIDIDITFQPAAEAIERLARELFEERGRVLVRIGKPPKRAILLRTDEPFQKLSRIFVAPDGSEQKIEVLCDGQQVVVDGFHPDTGKPYCWHGGSPIEVSRDDLPYVRREDVGSFINAASKLLTEEYGFSVKVHNNSSKGNGAAHDYPHADWSELIANILAGRDLHDSAMRLAAAYIASGMNEHSATRAIEALFLTSDTPRDERWKARFNEIGRAVRSAGEKFGKTEHTGAEAQSAPSPTAEDLRAMQFEPIKYVVPGVIVEGLTLFAGKPKIGKSWLLLHAAIAVARGGFTLGDIHCSEGDTCYFALEDNLRRLKSRMSKLLGTDAVWPARLRFKIEMPRLVNGGLDVIKDWIKSVPYPRLIIIDTLAMVRAPRKRDESSYDADYSAVKELRTLANENGLAIVIVHHLRKQDSDDAFDTVSGTPGLTGAPDTILVLKRDTTGTIILHGRGRDLVEVEKALTFNKDACTWTIAGNAGELRVSAERKAILAALREHGEPAMPHEVAAIAMLKRDSVRHLLIKMAKDGLVKRDGKGRYEAVL